jgi:hypothetical protein
MRPGPDVIGKNERRRQRAHYLWSFDAGFLCTLDPNEALRFARGEEVDSTYGVPARLSRPVDWRVMTTQEHAYTSPTLCTPGTTTAARGTSSEG